MGIGIKPTTGVASVPENVVPFVSLSAWGTAPSFHNRSQILIVSDGRDQITSEETFDAPAHEYKGDARALLYDSNGPLKPLMWALFEIEEFGPRGQCLRCAVMETQLRPR